MQHIETLIRILITWKTARSIPEFLIEAKTLLGTCGNIELRSIDPDKCYHFVSEILSLYGRALVVGEHYIIHHI